MLRHLYTALFTLALPLVLARFWWRGRRLPAYRERLAERFGRSTLALPAGSVWIHAVSVGEVQASLGLVRWLREQQVPLVLTTTTPTGAERARHLFGGSIPQVYCPLDLPFAVRAFLRRARPRLAILIETELWPNILAECARTGVSTVLANGRLSARSARGYGRLGRTGRDLFGALTRVAAQTPDDAARFRALGVPAQRLVVTGSIKFDAELPASQREQVEVIRRHWQGRPVWVAASTHEGEEDVLLDAHRQVRQQLPDALLVLVPRHPDRFDRVAGLLSAQNCRWARRSGGQPPDIATEVILGDTMGELPSLLGAGDIGFIGGSLVAVGGHNPLEAAAQGVPILVGPQTFNFASITAQLVACGAARRVSHAQDLARELLAWFSAAERRSEAGELGKAMVDENRGALQRLQTLLSPVLADVATTDPRP